MKVIIAAAGTGGHINPGIAIANKIKKEEPTSDIVFIGTTRGLENDLVPRAGYELKTIESYGFGRKLTISNIKKVLANFKGIKEAKKIIQKFKPDVVIGAGGYICGPVFLAAKKYKIPTILHESNAFPGVTVKMLSKSTDKILVGFEDAKKRLPKAKQIVVTGNPTKMKYIELPEAKKEEIKNSLGLKNKLPLVLVFGGSQGAQSINTTLIEIISKKINKHYEIIWAAGPKQYEIIKEELEEKNISIHNIENVKIVPYIYNMEEIMNTCDLIVSRSGAMTITEVAITGKPAIFIPFPKAAENHQEYNAKVLKNAEAAEIILDKDLTAEKLNNTIEKIIKDKTKLKQMSENARKIAKTDVEEKIYKEIKKILR